MADMIFRSNAIERMKAMAGCDACNNYDGVRCRACTWNDAMDIVDELPAVDAVPVKCGRWVHHEGGFNDHFECTACGEAIVLTGKWRFCPNCGARMDGEADE